MPTNLLSRHLPQPVGEALKTLGGNLRTARVRRGLTVQEAAEQIGVSRQLVAEAERGKPTTSAAVYAALVWAYGLLDQWAEVAAPARDKAGLVGALIQGGSRVRRADDS